MMWEKYDINYFSAEEYEKWYSLMSDEKKQKINKYKSEERKKQAVAGEMLSRKMISEMLNISPESIIFEKNAQGKPFAYGLDIHFNISHSQCIVVCAIDSKPIGIDVEKLREYKHSVAKRFCTDEEIAIIEKSQCPSEEFTKIWTMKEAYSKRIGAGLLKSSIKNIPLENILQYRSDDYFISISLEER